MIKRHVNLIVPHHFSGVTVVGDDVMQSSQPAPEAGVCSRCGECCRWLPVALVRQCKPHQLLYFRERDLKKPDGFFLVDAPCQHLHEKEPDGNGVKKWGCAIYDWRPASCRDFCGKTLSGGKRYYVPEGCTLADKSSSEPGDGQEDPVPETK